MENRALRINLPCETKLFFHVTQPSHRSAQPLSAPLKTGHAEFDRHAVVQGYPESDVVSFFRSHFARRLISQLFILGYTEIDVSPNGVSAIWSDYPTDMQPSQELITQTHSLLGQMAGYLPQPVHVGRYLDNRPSWQWLMGILLVMLLGLSVLWFQNPAAPHRWIKKAAAALK